MHVNDLISRKLQLDFLNVIVYCFQGNGGSADR